MQGDPNVIQSLQTTCTMLARMVEQYRADARQLRAMDVDWLAARVERWYAKTEKHLGIVIDALLYFESDPVYSVPEVSKATDITELLNRNRAIAFGAFAQLCVFRKAAWDVLADDVPDIYEHIIQALKKQIVKMDRELKLIAGMGESNYIAARLEDGEETRNHEPCR